MNDIAITPINLAYMGIMDDFYDLYCEIKSIYEEHKKVYIHEHSTREPLLCRAWDELCIRDVRKKFEPLLNKYRYLLDIDCSEVHEIHARAYAFSEFSFLKKAIVPPSEKHNSPFMISFKSFSDFLIEIQIVMAILDYRYNCTQNSKYSFVDSWTSITHKIEILVSKEKKECQNILEDRTTNSDNTLYIFDRLSSTACWKYDHPIISSRYIAMIAKTSQLIALPVHYCNSCKKYFIGSKTLSVFEKEFGKLAILKKDISEMKWTFESFSPESKLHSLGYNVIYGKLSEEERKQLLIHLIESQLISYVELCSTIEQNINIFKNSYRHRHAVEKWTIDLKAIGEYILSHPEKKV